MFASKDELERRYVERFLVSIAYQVTVERLPPGSGPDFGARHADAVTGIELTRVYREDRERGIPYRQAEGIWDQVLSGAHTEWPRLGLPPVTVYVRTIPGAVPARVDITRVVGELVSFVSTRVPTENESASYEPDWRSWEPLALPEGVARIDISRPSYHTTTYWFMPRSGMVPDLSSELLQKSIDAKNARLRRYSAAPPSNWLVLIVEGSAPSSTFTITPEAREHIYESAFQRTFLFDVFAGRTFELETKRSSETAA